RVLDLGRRDVLATARDDDVLETVHDLDVRAVDPLAHVSGVHPPVRLEDLGRRLRHVPVADEHGPVTDQDLTGVRVDLQFGAPVGRAHGPDLDVARRVCRGDGRVLGHPVGLDEGDADAHVELEYLGGDRRGAVYGAAQPTQTDAILEGTD